MASNEDTSTPKPKKKLFARWRRKDVDADYDAPVSDEVAVSPDGGDTPPVEVLPATEEISDTDVLRGGADEALSTAVDLAEVPEAIEEASIEPDEQANLAVQAEDELDHQDTAAVEKPKRRNVFSRALSKTGRGLEALFLGRRQIDENMLEELETQLLMADVGVEVCTEIIDELTDRVKRRELSDSDALREALHQIMVEMLAPCELALDVTKGQPCVILVVGVNGVGKTTTIGKLARSYQNQGLSVMLAAGDTFRAAAVEQLQVWGERNNVPVIAQHTGADSASVIYDAIESAIARNIDVLIADTAGRLHTKSNLMDELAKVKRVMAKLSEDAPHEALLVLDAGTGQNAVRQVQEFNETVTVTGLAITKLDGTAKGGVVLALCKRYGIPVRYIGVGEGLDDLQRFRADDYVQALLSEKAVSKGSVSKKAVPEMPNDQ
ncbi:MAG: signal recognition particle-docking protein FtsY [Porticoccaceae bacterium]|nr:signal recognition particle-docking protein FtsY [Porticoccaceae bacterium]